MRLRNLYFELSGGCNLLCKHCYIFDDDTRRARPDLLDAEKVEQVLRGAIPLGLSECTFTGGEILLRRDLLAILERAAHYVHRLFLLTNLTLLQDAHVEAFKRLPIALVSTSLDGFRETHDRFRGLDGAFDRTLGALQRLREAGIPVKVSVTATEDNLHELDTIFTALDAAGIPSSIARVAPVGRGAGITQPGSDFDRAYSLHLAKHIGKALTRQQVVSMRAPETTVETHCGVGSDILYIMSDGQVAYCPTLTSAVDKRWSLGNVLATPISEIWRDGEVFGAGPLQCRHVAECCFGEVCRGGCRANAFAATGDVSACDSEMHQGFETLVDLVKKPRKSEYQVV